MEKSKFTSEIKHLNVFIKSWLRENEIWFKTVLTLAVSIAALLVSISSCRIAQYQSKMTAISIENQNREKLPFFSIKQDYSYDKKQFIYRIENTGGEIRYFTTYVLPYLHILQSSSSNGYSILRHAFIMLPGFYCHEPTIYDNELLAFRDVWIDSPMGFNNLKINCENDKKLADDYFSYLCSWNNDSELMDTFFSSELIYSVQIDYYDYKNELSCDTYYLARSVDDSGKLDGNCFLYIQPLMDQWLSSAKNSGNYIEVDTLNLPMDEALSQCRDYIKSLFEEFNQIPQY